MDTVKLSRTERDQTRMQACREELTDRLAHAVQQDGTIQPLTGVHLARASTAHRPLHAVLEPSFCVIAQGSKEVLLGDRRYLYDPSTYLITTLELPRVSQILDASNTRPYLSFRLSLDSVLVSSVMIEAGHQMKPQGAVHISAINTHPLNADLLDAVLRVVRLIDSPSTSSILLPMITREIIYRLLIGGEAARLRHIAFLGGYTPVIAQAVQRIRDTFDQPLRVEQLARDLSLSVSAFHHHFKAVTTLSPLQFQKQLRLQEARRLMLSENIDASTAGYRVGYSDASHFNREYKSVFGMPPMRDIQHMREAENAQLS